jgi:hypothetical protein
MRLLIIPIVTLWLLVLAIKTVASLVRKLRVPGGRDFSVLKRHATSSEPKLLASILVDGGPDRSARASRH